MGAAGRRPPALPQPEGGPAPTEAGRPTGLAGTRGDIAQGVAAGKPDMRAGGVCMRRLVMLCRGVLKCHQPCDPAWASRKAPWQHATWFGLTVAPARLRFRLYHPLNSSPDGP